MEDYEGTLGDDSHAGTSGDDTLDGSGGNDTLLGLGGRDYIFGGLGNDSLDGGDGNDFIVASTGKDTLIGGAGDDTLSASGGLEADRVDGGTGNDDISGSTGDVLIGGAGTDFLALYMTESTASVSWDLHRLANGTLKASDGTQISGFESGYIFLGRGADSLALEDTGAFIVDSGDGNDTVIGGDGDDFIRGGLGDDVLSGGDGIDTLDCWGAYEDGGVAVTLARAGTVQNTHGQGRDLVSGFENLFGTESVDRLTGDGGDNYLWGNGGQDSDAHLGDSLYGGAGADTLESGGVYSLMDGGAGDDRIGFAYRNYNHLFTGYDTLVGGKGQDTLSLRDGSTALYKSVKESTNLHPDHIVLSQDAFEAKIDLHLIDADKALDGDQAFTLVDVFTRHAGELVVLRHALEGGGSETWVLMDVTGNGRADSKIVIAGDHHDFQDFVL